MEPRETWQTLSYHQMAFSQARRFKCPFVPSYLGRKESIPDLQELAFQGLSLLSFAQKQEKKVHGAWQMISKSVCLALEHALLTSWPH